MTNHYRKLLVTICLSLSVLAVGLGLWASTAVSVQPSKVLPQTQSHAAKARINRKNMTDALEVVAATPMQGGMVKVSLRNVSKKNINGIQLGINGGVLQIEFLDADSSDNQRLLPGAIYQETFPFDGKQPVEVAILAVTFDDKTSAGKTSLADEIFETRRGVKKQLARFKRPLAEARKALDADSIVVLDRLRAQAIDLPEGDDNDSGAIRMGQLQAKQQIIQEIDFLKDRHFRHPGLRKISESVSEMETRHERRLRLIDSSVKQ